MKLPPLFRDRPVAVQVILAVVLPIAFGALNDLTGLWSSCFVLLFAIVVGLFVWMDIAIRRMERGDRPQGAVAPSEALYAAE